MKLQLMEHTFDKILKGGLWGEPYKSGSGSTFESTKEYRKFLKKIIKHNNISKIADLGCGNWDFYHEEFDTVKYWGYDCVKKIIDINTEKFGNSEMRKFVHKDMSQDGFELDEPVDLIIMKDVLQHLSHQSIEKILSQVRSQTKFIWIVNDHHNGLINKDVADGGHRPLCMFGNPLEKFSPRPIKPILNKMIMIIPGMVNGTLRDHQEFSLCDHNKEFHDTVFIAILARNKAYCLDTYLRCLTNLDYNKKLITIYIRTNNNVDETESILEAWIEKNKAHYHDVIYDDENIPQLNKDVTGPHEWNRERTKILGKIREKSLKMAADHDYYFVSDCDNFVTNPFTLKDLIKQRKPIICPMLKCMKQDSGYSNFWTKHTDKWYFQNDNYYHTILNWRRQTNHKVPVVHCTYLVDCKYVKQLSYIERKGKESLNFYEFAVFCRSAVNNNVSQYVRNEYFYGWIFLEGKDIETEREIFSKFESQIC